MEHMVVDLGQLGRGTVVELHLSGNAANVWLMDSSKYSQYKRGKSVRAIGGHTRRSPVRLQTDRSTHWYAVADLGGYRGRLGLEARVLPGPAAPIRQVPNLPSGSPLVRFAEELPDEAFEDRDFDVFISHASEDKATVVRPLAEALTDLDVDVWYDEFELRIGDSLRRKIDHGIARSRFRSRCALEVILREELAPVRAGRSCRSGRQPWRRPPASDLARDHERRSARAKPFVS